MQPRPSADTIGPAFPSARNSIRHLKFQIHFFDVGPAPTVTKMTVT
jgi:hypothetical protein